MHKYLLITFLAALNYGTLRADTLTYTAIPSRGHVTYDFTLTNSGATSGSIFDLFLTLPTAIGDIDTASIETPVGWGDPSGGLLFFGEDVSPSTSFIEWSSDFSGVFDLKVGDSLSGFSFDSSVTIDQPIRFALNGSTDFGTATVLTTTVPEPSSAALLTLAILIVAWRRFDR